MNAMKVTLASMLLVCMAAVTICSLLGLHGCATFKADVASGKVSSQIAYYDKYVEGAQTWASLVLPFLPLPPGVSPAVMASLALIDAALDRAKAQADAYKTGTAPEVQVTQALNDVKTTVLDFNTLVGQIRAKTQ